MYVFRNSYLIAAIAILSFSCGQTDSKEVEMATGTSPRFILAGNDDERINVLYSMPTPNELFELINTLHSPVDKEALYDVSLATSTDDTLLIAYRFGLCATDLVYASYFDLTSEVVRYYLTTKALSEEIGVHDAFNRIDVRRLERNLSRGDSLTILSNEAYLKAYEHLDKAQKGDVLAMVLAGGWVETTHLLIEQIGDYDSSNDLIDRLAEQKFGLAQLVDLMAMNGPSDELDEFRERLIELQEIFELIVETDIAEDPKPVHGRQHLGGEASFEMTPLKFAEISKAVAALRGGITHNF